MPSKMLMKTQSMVVTQSQTAKYNNFMTSKGNKHIEFEKTHKETKKNKNVVQELESIESDFEEKQVHHQSVVVFGTSTSRGLVDPIGPQKTKS